MYWKVNKDTPLLLQLRLYALLSKDISIYWYLSLSVVLQEMKRVGGINKPAGKKQQNLN